jgi:hypothetical protein
MAEKKERKTELFKVFIQHSQSDELYDEEIILKSILESFFTEYLCETIINKVFEIKSKNLKYWFSYYERDNNIDKIKLSYVIYNRKLKIRDVADFKISKYKNKNEGDEEKQHFIIKYYDSSNKAILVFEKVLGAITVGVIQKKIDSYFHKKYKELKNYEICILPVPSPEFLYELANMKKISLLKVTVDREKASIDEDITFSEDNVCRDELDMVFKPFSKLSFSKSNVEKYYKKYLEKKSDGKIKRIVVEGRNEKNRVRLDTEGMRLSKYTKTEIDIDGLVDTDSIFKNYENLLNKEFNDYLSDIVLDIDEGKGE